VRDKRRPVCLLVLLPFPPYTTSIVNKRAHIVIRALLSSTIFFFATVIKKNNNRAVGA